MALLTRSGELEGVYIFKLRAKLIRVHSRLHRRNARSKPTDPETEKRRRGISHIINIINYFLNILRSSFYKYFIKIPEISIMLHVQHVYLFK